MDRPGRGGCLEIHVCSLVDVRGLSLSIRTRDDEFGRGAGQVADGVRTFNTKFSPVESPQATSCHHVETSPGRPSSPCSGVEGPLSRTEIARRLSVSPATITAVTRELVTAQRRPRGRARGIHRWPPGPAPRPHRGSRSRDRREDRPRPLRLRRGPPRRLAHRLLARRRRRARTGRPRHARERSSPRSSASVATARARSSASASLSPARVHDQADGAVDAPTLGLVPAGARTAAAPRDRPSGPARERRQRGDHRRAALRSRPRASGLPGGQHRERHRRRPRRRRHALPRRRTAGPASWATCRYSSTGRSAAAATRAASRH